jgi:hypothetical protein
VTRAALLVVVLALAAPAVARAELIATGVASGALAVGPDGPPRVAYVDGSALVLATRTPSGWTSERVARLPGTGGVVAGIAVSPAGRVTVLAEASSGRWLVLWERTRALRSLLPHLPTGARIGRAGLALDRSGLPVVAYAEWRRSKRTFLRVVRFSRGRYRTSGVTRGGFPPSDVAPAATPVLLPNGAVRVVEAYQSGGSAAIDWMPQRHDWLGQFLYTSPLAALVGGGIWAAASPAGVYAAWTVGFPQLGTIAVVLAHHGTPVESELAFDDAVLAGLALGGDGPTLAATAPVGDGLRAALVRGPDGSTIELDGAAAAIAPGPQVLLARNGGLEWYALPPVLPHVSLTATPVPSGVALSGSVSGTTGGSVTLYRESPGERVAIASAPLSPDGSFGPIDDAPSGPAFYRAVYVDPASGVPIAMLLRSAVAPG